MDIKFIKVDDNKILNEACIKWDNSVERNERRNWMIIRRNAVGVL